MADLNGSGCSICHKTRGIIDGLCEPCYRAQRIAPIQKELENTRSLLGALESAKLNHERRIYEARYETFSKPQAGATAADRVQFFYCVEPGCKAKFSFKTDRDKHQARCREEQDERTAQALKRQQERKQASATTPTAAKTTKPSKPRYEVY